MMPTHYKIYQVDAFTSELFKGNPAAVVFLDTWLADHLMLQIAQENALAETAFLIEKKDPLVLPPDFSELPRPKEKSVLKENEDENFVLDKVFNQENQNIDNNLEDNKSSDSKLKKSILKKIK